MDSTVDISPTALAVVYGRFFIQDTARDVMRHLAGSHRIDANELNAFVANATSDLCGSVPLVIGNTDSINRFLFECAQHAVDSGYEDPESYATWQAISALPSAHHDEICNLVYTMAVMYLESLSAIDVVVNDARTAAATIVKSAQTRTSSVEVGGSLHLFNWGILNEGMWLHGALIKAFELASIFRPGDTPVAYYTSVAFDFARPRATMLYLEDDAKQTCLGELSILLSHCPAEQLDPLLESFNQTELADILFSSGHLENLFAVWQRGSTNTAVLLQSVDQLSVIARILTLLISTAKSLSGDGDLVGSITLERLERANDVVVLVLVGYEALRETKYAEAVILDVRSENDDPKVDVVVNNDLMSAFSATGMTDEDLVNYGVFYDPRRGIPVAPYGVPLRTMVDNRYSVIPKVIAEHSDRLEALRNNDSRVIQAETLRIVNDVVNSYLQAVGVDTVPITIRQRIDSLSFDVTKDAGDFELDTTILGILIDVVGNDHLKDMTQTVVRLMANADNTDKLSQISGLAIAEATVRDIHSAIVSDSAE
jgi:hypothetical protein